MADELAGRPEAAYGNRPVGAVHGPHRPVSDWAAQRQQQVEFVNGEPTVLIVGGGLAFALSLLGGETLWLKLSA